MIDHAQTIDIYFGILLKGLASLPSFVLSVLLVATGKILAVKAGTSIHLESALFASLPFQPVLLVPSASALVLLTWIFCKFICFAQSTSLWCKCKL